MRVLFLFVKGLFAKDGVIIELGFGYIFYWRSFVGGGVQMYKRQIWRYPSRAQKRNNRCMPVPGSAKKKSVISYLSTERVFRSVGHRKDLSLFLSSQRMPSRYGGVCYFIQNYSQKTSDYRFPYKHCNLR